MFYGGNIWDPIYILVQILTVQCLYYLGFGAMLYVLVGPTVRVLTISYLFDYRTLE